MSIIEKIVSWERKYLWHQVQQLVWWLEVEWNIALSVQRYVAQVVAYGAVLFSCAALVVTSVYTSDSLAVVFGVMFLVSTSMLATARIERWSQSQELLWHEVLSPLRIPLLLFCGFLGGIVLYASMLLNIMGYALALQFLVVGFPAITLYAYLATCFTSPPGRRSRYRQMRWSSASDLMAST